MYVLGAVGTLISTFEVGQMLYSLSLSQDMKNIYIGLLNGQIQNWNLSSNPQPYRKIETNIPYKRIGKEFSNYCSWLQLGACTQRTPTALTLM